MLVAPAPLLPPGTPPPAHRHHRNRYEYTQEEDEPVQNGVSERAPPSGGFFRDVKSAPAPPKRNLDEFGESQEDDDSSSTSSSSSSSSSYSSPSVDNNNSSSMTKIHKRAKSSKDEKHKKKCCRCCTCCTCCSSISFSNFFFGHAPSFTTWSTSYAATSRLKYLSLFFLEASLRSIGDVTFCSNPFSGLLIFIAMLMCSPLVAFLAFVTLTFGIETAVVFLHTPMEDIRSGGVTFNNFLTGTVIALIAQPDVVLAKPDIIAVCIAVGVLTVIIWKGLNGMLATSILEFPMLNAPFHLMILLYVYSGIASRYEPIVETIHGNDMEGIQSENLQMRNGSSHLLHHLLGEKVGPTTTESSHFTPVEMDQSWTFVEPLDWQKVFFGILLAPSQVFGTDKLCCSLMVHLGVFIYSPIMCLQTLTGAAIGTLMGICFTNPEDYAYLYDGSWAYNPLFTAAAIGGFFVVFNFHTWFLSIVGAVLTTLLYAAMKKCHVPAFGIPFMLITWLLLPSIPPPQRTSHNQSDDTPEVVVIRADDDDVKRKLAFEDEKKEKVDDQNKEESLSGPFIRLHLADITTPEEHRRRYLLKKNSVKRKSKKSSSGRRSGHKSKGKDGNNEVETVSTVNNGVMNKYKSSISEAMPQEELPEELALGIGQNAILPL